MKRVIVALTALVIVGFLVAPGLASAEEALAFSRPSARSITLDAAQSPQIYSTASVSVGVTVHTYYVTIRITSVAWVKYTGQKVYLVYKVYKPTGSLIGGTSYTLSPCSDTSSCNRTVTLTGATQYGLCWAAGTYTVHAWGYSATSKTGTVRQRSNVAEAVWNYPTGRCEMVPS